jgi:pimeloyl-ACP methyl ester carboxylesterase
MSPDLQEASLPREGCEIAYEVAGDGARRGDPRDETVVLLHGFGTSRVCMRPLSRELLDVGAACRAIGMDLRGHGATRAPERKTAYSYPAMRDDLLALLRELCPDGAHLIGHSMGGQVALMAAIAAPERVRSLTTVGAGPCREITHERERESWERAARFFEQAAPDELCKSLAAAAPADADAHPDLAPERLYAGARGSDLARVVRGGFFEVRSNDAECELLRLPTLVVSGSRDAGWLEPSRRLAALIPGARLQVVKGAGHWVHLEQTDALRRSFVEFLRGQDQVESARSGPAIAAPIATTSVGSNSIRPVRPK